MQVYKDDGSSSLIITDSPLFNEPIILRYTEYENWVIDQIVRDYKNSGEEYREPRPHELAEIFPQSKPILNAQNKEIGVRLGELLEEDRKINAEMQDIKQRVEREGLQGIIQAKRDKLLERRETNKTILGFMNPKKSGAVKNFQVELARAKTFPIDKILDFQKKKATCLWHGPDADASLYYYKKDNRVHCFVCEKGGDSVDVVMQKKGCSIGDAIRFLNQA